MILMTKWFKCCDLDNDRWIDNGIQSISMTLSKCIMSLTAFGHWRSLISVRKRAKDSNSDCFISRIGLEMVELVGSGNNLRWCLDNFEGFIVASTLLVDLGFVVVDKISIFLCDLAFCWCSKHDVSYNKKICWIKWYVWFNI